MKYLKYCGFLALVGIMGGLHGCASSIDALSNNTSGDMIRGVKLQAGVDASSGNPVPSVNFSMGSLARKGKGDRMAMVIDNNTTDILCENYEVDIMYENVGTSSINPRQLIRREIRRHGTSNAGHYEEGIFVHQIGTFGMGVTAGNLMSAGGTTIISIGKVGTNTSSASGKSNLNDIIKAIVNTGTGSGTTKGANQ